MNLDIIARPVFEPLGCSLVNFPVLSKVVSSDLEPMVGVWDIGCSSAISGPIHPATLCEGSQEAVLQSYIGGFGQLSSSGL